MMAVRTTREQGGRPLDRHRPPRQSQQPQQCRRLHPKRRRSWQAGTALIVATAVVYTANAPSRSLAFVWPALPSSSGVALGRRQAAVQKAPDERRCSGRGTMLVSPKRRRAHGSLRSGSGPFDWGTNDSKSEKASGSPTTAAAPPEGDGKDSSPPKKDPPKRQSAPEFTIAALLSAFTPDFSMPYGKKDEKDTGSSKSRTDVEITLGEEGECEEIDENITVREVETPTTAPAAPADPVAAPADPVAASADADDSDLQDQAEEGEGFAEGEAAIADEEIGEGDDEETSGHEKGRRKDMYKIRSLLLQGQMAGLREKLKQREVEVKELRLLTGGMGQSKIRELGALLKEARNECDDLRAREQSIAQELAISQKEGDSLRGDLLTNQQALSDLNVYADSLRSRYTAEMVKLEASLAEMERELTRAEAAHMRERRELLDREASAVTNGQRFLNRTILLQGEMMKTRARETDLRRENARLAERAFSSVETEEESDDVETTEASTDGVEPSSAAVGEDEVLSLRRDNDDLRQKLDTVLGGDASQTVPGDSRSVDTTGAIQRGTAAPNRQKYLPPYFLKGGVSGDADGVGRGSSDVGNGGGELSIAKREFSSSVSVESSLLSKQEGVVVRQEQRDVVVDAVLAGEAERADVRENSNTSSSSSSSVMAYTQEQEPSWSPSLPPDQPPQPSVSLKSSGEARNRAAQTQRSGSSTTRVSSEFPEAMGFSSEEEAKRAFQEAGIARVVEGLRAENTRLRNRFSAVQNAAEIGENRAAEEARRADELERKLGRVRMAVKGKVQALKVALEEAEGDVERAQGEKEAFLLQWEDDVDALRLQLDGERKRRNDERKEMKGVIFELEDEIERIKGRDGGTRGSKTPRDSEGKIPSASSQPVGVGDAKDSAVEDGSQERLAAAEESSSTKSDVAHEQWNKAMRLLQYLD